MSFLNWLSGFLNWLSGVAMFLSLIGIGSFVLIFHALVDWRATIMGRHMMKLMSTITVIIGYAWYNLAFGLNPWVQTSLRLVAFAFLAYIAWRQVALLIQVQSHYRVRTLDGEQSSDLHA